MNEIFEQCWSDAVREAKLQVPPLPDAPGPRAKKTDAAVAYADVFPVDESGTELFIPRVSEVSVTDAQRLKVLCEAAKQARTLVPPTRASGGEKLETDKLSQKLGPMLDEYRLAKQQGRVASELKPRSVAVGPLLEPTVALLDVRKKLAATLAPVDKDVCLRVEAGTVLSRSEIRALADMPRSIYSLTAEVFALDAASLDAESPPAQPAQGNLGSLESALIQGLADFVVTRAKAESIEYLRKKLKEDLCGDKSEAAAYLPSTCAALGSLDDKLSLQATGAYLQAATTRDVRRMPEAVLRGIHAPSRSVQQQAWLLGLAFYREALAGRQPLEIAWSVRRSACPGLNGGKTWLGSLDVRACLAAELVTAIERVADTSAPASKYSRDAISSEFSELVKQDFIGKPVLDPTELATLMDRLGDLAQAVQAVERDATSIAKSGKVVPAAERLAVTSRALTALIEAARLSACLASTRPDGAPPQGSACGEGGLEAAEEIAEIASADFANDTAAMIARAAGLLKGVSYPMPPTLQRALPVLAEMANAKTSKDVASTLEAATAPVGSYASKYERSVIAINAMLGVSGGSEWDGANSAAGTLGGFAPVGIHATVPLKPDVFHAGLLVSILDIGALTQARLSGSDSISQAPNVGVAQVFSPGLFATLGLFGSPFVLGLGGEITPALRTQTEANGSNRDVPSLRLGGFLALDVPLFPF